jgi:hypothetical protein
MEYLSQTEQQFDDSGKNAIDKILEEAVVATQKIQGFSEATLTNSLGSLIRDAHQKKSLSYGALNELVVSEPLQSHGKIDIILTQANPNDDDVDPLKSTPLAVIEFGMRCEDWWKKFHQATKYITKMMSPQRMKHLTFQRPILLTTATIHVNKTKNSVVEKFRIGVFLCVPKNKDNPEDLFQISLLWNTEVDSLDAASKAFGKFLCVTNDFASWRNNDCLSKGYKYFSSNCCKVKDRSGNDMVRTCLTIFWSGVNAVVLSLFLIHFSGSTEL